MFFQEVHLQWRSGGKIPMMHVAGAGFCLVMVLQRWSFIERNARGACAMEMVFQPSVSMMLASLILCLST